MKKAKKILAAAMVLLAASSFVFTSCDPEVPENNNTEQTGGDNTSGESTDKDSGSTDETPAAKEYTVTFDKADGSESPKSTAKVKDGEKAEKPADPTKTGYTFAGWFAKDAAEAFDFESTISADTTLTAKWTVVEYTITYTLGEGETNAETNPAKYTIESDDITLAAPTGTADKPNFVAWHNGTADGTTVTSIKKGSTGNLTLVAEFTDKTTFKVTFYNGETKLDELNVVDGDKVAADKQGAVAVEGYDFVGWYSDAALKTAFDFTKPITAATSVYGKYTKSVTYKVTVNGVDQDVKAGEKAKKPADPTQDGKKFLGWYVGDAAYDFETPVTKDLVIVAKWEDEETIPTYELISTEENPFAIKYTDGEYCELTGIIPNETVLKTGDKLKFIVKGKADKDISNLRIVIAECVGSTGWSYKVLGETTGEDVATILAHTDFEKTIVVEIKENQINETIPEAHRLRLYCGDETTNDTIKIYPQGTDTEAKLAADIAAEEEAARNGSVLKEPAVVDWGSHNVVIKDGTDFTGAISIKITFEGSGSDAEDYYCKFKFLDSDWTEYGAGTITGASIERSSSASTDDYNGVTPTTKPADDTTEYEMIYTPNAEEWTRIKQKGFAITGAGAKVTKIQLVK